MTSALPSFDLSFFSSLYPPGSRPLYLLLLSLTVLITPVLSSFDVELSPDLHQRQIAASFPGLLTPLSPIFFLDRISSENNSLPLPGSLQIGLYNLLWTSHLDP